MSHEKGLSEELKEKLTERRQDTHEGTLEIRSAEAYVGDVITITGTDLMAHEPYHLYWNTARGRWGVIGGAEVVGPQFQPHTKRIAGIRTNQSGEFDFEWKIPEDYGGEHTVELRSETTETVATTTINLVPWFDIDRTTVPLGDAFTITGYGLGPNMLRNNYQITWDNGMVGFITGTMNQGTATAELRAVGPPGQHVIQVWRNVRGVPFLQNNTQSPFGPVAGGRQSLWEVTVTEPRSELKPAWMDPLVPERPLEIHYPDVKENADAELTITPCYGQPGTTSTIQGSGFPADTTVDLVWYTHVGNRVAGVPITPEPRPDVIPTATTDEQGEFTIEVTIPREMGGTRPITAEVNDRADAVTGFMMQPDIVKFSPTEGPVGTPIEIELTGIGWPTYENAYFFVYDNKPLGYVCGMDMHHDDEGIVRTVLPAAGEPGHHFIDVYPSLFETREDEPDFEQKAHLSYSDNHPVRSLPAIHFTFKVTD